MNVIDLLHHSTFSLAQLGGLRQVLEPAGSEAPATKLEIFHGYIWVFVVAFLVTLGITPIMRRLAIANGIVDRPNEARKVHKQPIAYLGGVAVFAGILAGILYSYLAAAFPFLLTFHRATPDHLDREYLNHFPVPLSIVAGLLVITVVGMIDDVKGMYPRVKVGGQLFAAAALAYQDVGVRVAQQVMSPIGHLIGNDQLLFNIPLPINLPIFGPAITIDVIYWVGTAIIAIFVLGACNASNLIDGLDGLLSGVTAIAGMGLLVVALGLAAADTGPRDAQRIILCMAMVGACMGFLPHNFNPANIFLGDAGSLQLGYLTIVIILTLGNEGQTSLVIAGLFIYAIPIIDTALAIVRRKLAGKKMSDADSDHLHHMLKRSLGVKGAVFALYGIGGVFAVLGVMMSESRARVVYLIAMIVAAYIGVTAIKVARRKQLETEPASATPPALPTETPAPSTSPVNMATPAAVPAPVQHASSAVSR
jgi:UDP-GlcNAc:undecaprenyl-phosphate GlcNAc-1-phosphate transferase